MTKSLRLEIAQYNELLDFSQFGTELDIISQKRLARGALAQEILKQTQFTHYSFVDETIIIFLLKENFLHDIKPKNVRQYIQQCVSYIQSVYSDLYTTILESKDLSEESAKLLFDAAQEFKKIFVPSDELT